jgi:hypothetical protein
MARVMLFVRRPSVLTEAEAIRWMRDHAAHLAAEIAVERVQLTRLQTPAVHGGGDCEWLIEMHCDSDEAATRAARDRACRELIADLRLLGMHPRLVVADGGEPRGI